MGRAVGARSGKSQKARGLAAIPRRELEARLILCQNQHNIDGWFKLACTGVRWGGIVLCVFFARQAIGDLAGRDTQTSIGIKLDAAISYAAALGFGAMAVVQRKLRHDTVERLQRRITGLETQIDPDRSSSGLTPRGTTRTEDQ